MVTRMIWLPGHGTYTMGVTSEPYNPEAGEVEFTQAAVRHIDEEKPGVKVSAVEEASHPSVSQFLAVANLANLATVKRVCDEKDSDSSSSGTHWQAQGDPTEVAIQVFAARFGRNRDIQPSFDDSEWSQLVEFPFDSGVKKMSVLCQNKNSGDVHVFTKGAVERVIDSCAEMPGVDGSPVNFTEDAKTDVISNMEALARRGLRVLAFASRRSARPVADEEARQGTLKREDFETELVFRGLIGIYDPPRPESRPSVFKCHQAGIGVHMLTGDHPETARTIAKEVGILPSRMELLRRDVAEGIVMTAAEFDRLTDDQVDQLPELPLVVARCAPSTKVRMIDALHRRGRYVAMTGDGVNDSPSLHRADIGIAMGLAGSDVAKSASDIVLSDDNFASILNAVEEGRRIFDNIQKFMLHVLAANIGFVTTLLIGLGYKDASGVSIFQVTPVEILFMLLVAGTFTETGLGFESASPDILRRPPQSVCPPILQIYRKDLLLLFSFTDNFYQLKRGVFTTEFLADIGAYGFCMAVSLITAFVSVQFGLFDGYFGRDCNIKWSDSCNGVFRARSTCYTSMMWIFLFFAWELVDSRRSFFDGMISDTRAWASRLWRNPFLFWSCVLGFFSVFPTLYIPTINHVVFLHTGIDKEWGIVFACTILFMAGAESWKWAKRVYLRRNNLMMRKSDGLGEEDLEARVFQRFYESG